MHRCALVAELQQYRQRFPQESNMADRFIRFVQTYPNCFERSLSVGHVTGSAWVVNAAHTHALFTHHRKLDAWLQLGGHADGDCDVRRVALREVQEESGLAQIRLLSHEIFDIDIHRIPARRGEPAHEHYDVRFLVETYGDEHVVVSGESLDLGWFTDLEIAQRFRGDETMLRMARKWRDFVKFSKEK